MTAPSIRRFAPSDFRVMPWKNGGGTTTELAIEPPGASLGTGFHWRLSMADVASSGPFSAFEGCDRTLLLLEGRGMRLQVEGRPPVDLDRLLEPVAFSGDLPASGTLLDGPCRDFNVITRRTACRHRLKVLSPGAQAVPLEADEVLYLFAVSGTIRVEPLGIRLVPGELARLEGHSSPLRASAEGPGATLIAVGIHRLTLDQGTALVGQEGLPDGGTGGVPGGA